jgi:hypothetical protein
MGKDKPPEIPYNGHLKKFFEQELNANIHGEFCGGKVYKLKECCPPPRQWSLLVTKLADSTWALRPWTKCVVPPGVNPEVSNFKSVVVTEVLYCRPHVIVWVQNASGSQANFLFNELDGDFSPDQFHKSLDDAAMPMLAYWPNMLVEVQDLEDLHKGSQAVSMVLKKALHNIGKVNNAIRVAPANPAPANPTLANPAPANRAPANQGAAGARKRAAPVAPVPPAPSRDARSRKKDKTPAPAETTPAPQETRVAENTAVIEETGVAEASRPRKRLSRASKGKAKAGPSGQLPTGASDDATEEVTPPTQPTKRRKKKTPANGREKDLAEVTGQASPGTMGRLEEAFREECGVTAD